MELTAPDSVDGAASPGIREISLEELRRSLAEKSLVLLDVLPADSYAAGHIPGSVSLPLDEIAARAPTLLPDYAADIAVYCGSFT
jgi:rhodanese-related sulfurtransferase